jgi:acyl-CoA synthetase (AMP-forming)/AMP-acid ligase II
VVGLTDTKAIIIPDTYKNNNFIEAIEKVKAKHSCLEHIIVVSEERYEGTINFYDLIKDEVESSTINLDEVKPVGTDPFFIMFTSGTTGKPKAVLHLHSNVRFFISQLNKSLNIGNKEKIIVAPPLAHLTGLAVGVLTPLFGGNSMVLLSSWDVGKAVDLIKNNKPTYLVGVTPMLIDLVRYEKFE